ncbi:response regulator transcription factor [Luteolibacter flavescens]|uniref:Response regulator transcription factor n=1 Tax=Luteolibacter flavescens TaxID=1859460 RepID=A0ABT3FIR8_9BACT|nr:response regulator transcription factor [Luteolibacter flavescens]MCW1883467.1 response regulator transcription factor [Luteolibacter flavescens]
MDDHPLVREWLTNLINQQEDLIVCGEADTAPAALEAIIGLKPTVAIVDITLVDGSGLELVKDIRKSSPGTWSLVLSMHDERTYAERALRAGARGYVSKRDSTRYIIEAIRRVIAGKIYLSEEMTDLLTEKLAGGRPAGNIGLLSDRELLVFQMLGDGRSTREIGDSLKISIKTVQVYCARVKEKLALANHTELLREAMRWKESGGPG